MPSSEVRGPLCQVFRRGNGEARVGGLWAEFTGTFEITLRIMQYRISIDAGPLTTLTMMASDICIL